MFSTLNMNIAIKISNNYILKITLFEKKILLTKDNRSFSSFLIVVNTDFGSSFHIQYTKTLLQKII